MRVVGVHTSSKILAPGLRVDWVTADEQAVARLIDAKQRLGTCTNGPMPEDLDTGAVFPIAVAEGVAFIPGSAFSSTRRFDHALRLAFSATSGERTELGLTRLRSALEGWRLQA